MDRQYRHHTQANGAAIKRQLPTVEQALPYTPFASIVPFSPDVIPAPQAYTSYTSSVFASSDERDSARQTLKQLSSRASTAEGASRRLKSTIRDVQQFLNPDGLTQFKFKAPARARYDLDTISTRSKLPLTSFAKMMLDNSNVQYRYITPESLSPRSVERPTVSVRPTLQTPSIQPMLPQSTPTPSQICFETSQVLPAASRSLQAVIINTTLTNTQRTEYQICTEADSTGGAAASSSSIRRHTSNGAQSLNIDQRQKAEAAVRNLQGLMTCIFEAEDNLQPDTSGNASTNASSVFTSVPTGDGKTFILQAAVQVRLDSAVQKVIAAGRLDAIPIDSLARIQRLCESAVGTTEALRLHIGEGWAEQDIDDWLGQLEIADHTLYACRTLLRIMTAGRQEKELYPEDFLLTAMTALKHVVETGIVPIVEERKDGNERFDIAVSHRKPLNSLVQSTTKTLRLLGVLLAKSDVDEGSVTAAEYFCKTLVFTENAGSEKDAALGITSFENIRLCAMDVLASIFTRYVEQRQFIFDEILTSLEKLPATRQNARHFRLVDAKPIQLVSALLMRLVQTSATRFSTANQLKSKNATSEEADEEDEDEDSSSDEGDVSEQEEDPLPSKKRTAATNLMSLSKPLHEAAQSNAAYIVKILIQRALTTTKSSDEPYRKLLDIFTEDFLNVLGSAEWPAAELLLRSLLSQILGIVKNSKSAAPAKTLALELLGTMGSGILDLQAQTRNTARSLDTDQSDLSAPLLQLCDQLEQGEVGTDSLLGFQGPYRIVSEYLWARDVNDAQLQAARGYMIMDWAHQLCNGRDRSAGPEDDRVALNTNDLQVKVGNIMLDSKYLEDRHDFPLVLTAQGRLAAQIITLSSSFCRAFNTIFNILLATMNSEQTTVKSRSLKSVVMLLEKDPSVLDRSGYIMSHIYKCANDPSPLVRDSALGLIAKCLSLRPRLDSSASERIIERSKDAATGVRKRAMKMLKDIYLRHDKTPLRSVLANALLSRMQDTDETVVELASTIMEEIWFLPFHLMKTIGDASLQTKLHFRNQVAMLVQTVQENDEAPHVMESLLRQVLAPASKFAAANGKLCKELVCIMSDGIIDSSEIPEQPSQQAILRAMTVFAKASPKLFAPAQLERLEPYTQNLSNTDDLNIFRCVLVILRHTMPHLPSLTQGFLQKIQTGLLASVAKLPKPELAEVAPCLWSINGILKNPERLVTFMISVLSKIHILQGEDLAGDAKKASQLIRLMNIAGNFGKACDFQDHVATFRERLSWWKGDSVAGLGVDVLCVYTSPKQQLAVRVTALESICLISQAWPKQFLRIDVASAMDLVFADSIPLLEHVLLQGLEGFFCIELVGDQDAQDAGAGDNVAKGTDRLGNTYIATDQDSASAAIAQRFLQQILRLALASCGEIALTATRIVASINHQGLVHPKESGPALVALETCPNTQIATLAFQEHRALHNKHESMFEKEYMRAVQRAFTYQLDVIGSPTGFTGNPPAAKMQLLWEVLKSGNAKVRKKFLSNLAEKLDFDPMKLDTMAQTPAHLSFVRFCVENLAFFEYHRVDELLHLFTCLEKTFASTGTGVAQAIESDVLKLRVEATVGTPPTVGISNDTTMAGASEEAIDPGRLRHFTVSAQILFLIWETRTYLLRVWNLQKLKQSAKAKSTAKDLSRAPNKAAHGPSLTDAYFNRIADIMSALSTTSTQLVLCTSFVELISVDTDVKVGSEDDENIDLANRDNTPSDNTSVKSPSAPPGSSSRGRKRKPTSASTTPRKKRAGSKRPSVARRKSSSAKNDEDEDGDWY